MDYIETIMTNVVNLEDDTLLFKGEFDDIPKKIRSEYIPVRIGWNPSEQSLVVGVVLFRRGK